MQRVLFSRLLVVCDCGSVVKSNPTTSVMPALMTPAQSMPLSSAWSTSWPRPGSSCPMECPGCRTERHRGLGSMTFSYPPVNNVSLYQVSGPCGNAPPAPGRNRWRWPSSRRAIAIPWISCSSRSIAQVVCSTTTISAWHSIPERTHRSRPGSRRRRPWSISGRQCVSYQRR